MINADPKNVPAVERAYKVFLVLTASPRPMGISDLARELNLGKSTVHALVHTLVNLGLLEAAPENGRGFRPSETILAPWREALLKSPLARASEPLLTAFSDRNNLTALAGVFLHNKVLIVKAIRAPGFSISAFSGQLVPAWAGALGKLLAATTPPVQVRKKASWIAGKGPLDMKTFLAEVEETRIAGAAFDREEYINGVRALAARIPLNEPFQPLGAVWAVGLAPSLDDARLRLLGPELKSLAEEIGRRAADLKRMDDGSKNQADRRI